jgi:uncharacterized protein (DUF2062 family)
MMKTILNNIREIIRRLTTIKDNPREVARGYALGIFLATTPFVGFKIFIALFLSAVFRWNKIASVIGVYHVNPLTGPPFYALAFLIGKTVLGTEGQFVYSSEGGMAALIHLFTGAGHVFLALLTGGLIIGIPLTCIAFFSVRRLMLSRQRV